MVEKANPTICVELLLHLEVRIRGIILFDDVFALISILAPVSDHTPEKVRNSLLNALKNSFFKPSEEKFQFKGEIQMWYVIRCETL